MTREAIKKPAVDLVIRNAGQILSFADDVEGSVGLRRGDEIRCAGGRVVTVGPPEKLIDGATVIDAEGGVVTPGLVDPHTHPVFAGERSAEFGMKAEGRSYLEIHRAGGGIFATVAATRAASTELLSRRCAENLSALMAWGVTTCEAKSGYALELEGELRLLEVLRDVGAAHPMDVEATLLGAHAVPPEFEGRREAYVSLIVEEMIPRAAAEGLAVACDAYLEQGAFTAGEVRTIFEAARAAGLSLRLHAEQFSDQGGARLAAELGARSADHLEAISDDGIAAMAAAKTVAVILPGAALTCRCPWPPVAALFAAGVKVALGTDFNPGSSFSASLPLMMSLACTQLQMSCERAWRAVTIEAAGSLGRDDIGHLRPGARADLVIFDAPDYRYIPYRFGENHARTVIKGGKIVWQRPV